MMGDASSPQHVADEFQAGVDEFLAQDLSNVGWSKLRKRMVEWFVSLDESTRFEAALIVMKSRVYQHQLLMGDVQLESKTPLLMDATEFVTQLAPTINASAETIPRYLSEQIGRQATRHACETVLAESTDPRTHRGVATFLYQM